MKRDIHITRVDVEQNNTADVSKVNLGFYSSASFASFLFTPCNPMQDTACLGTVNS